MLAFLEGVILAAAPEWVIVRAGDIGYKVFRVGFDDGVGARVSLYLYDYIREDRHDLFGFPSQEYLEAFERMLGVDGVGPKLAMKILSHAAPQIVVGRIIQGDIDFLTGIPGVGKKTSQKIILELKGVLVSAESATAVDEEAADALMSLGYSRKDALAVLEKIDAGSTEDRIRQALQSLAR